MKYLSSQTKQKPTSIINNSKNTGLNLLLRPYLMTAVNTHSNTRIHSQWIWLESLWYDVVHAALTCLQGHGAVEFTGHRCTCERLLAVLPQEQRHLLPLLKYSPYKEVIEVKGNQQWCIIDDRSRGDLLTAAGWHILLLDEKGKS